MEEISRIEILNDKTSFQMWKFQINIMLEAKCLLKIVDGTLKKDTENYEKLDSMAKHIILMTIEKKHMPQLYECTISCQCIKRSVNCFKELKKGKRSRCSKIFII